ncbi:hypothetical protein V6N11_038969 [Hibiscus sabdariffa]|uniref:Uncharacterized protein n=1 Tax=Hibiscus sabdariffa TaxID=183260 RepID=A0ABR2SMC2_9ROSI
MVSSSQPSMSNVPGNVDSLEGGLSEQGTSAAPEVERGGSADAMEALSGSMGVSAADLECGQSEPISVDINPAEDAQQRFYISAFFNFGNPSTHTMCLVEGVSTFQHCIFQAVPALSNDLVMTQDM